MAWLRVAASGTRSERSWSRPRQDSHYGVFIRAAGAEHMCGLGGGCDGAIEITEVSSLPEAAVQAVSQINSRRQREVSSGAK